MGNTNQKLVIILPEGMEDTPVRIIRNEKVEELSIKVISRSETKKCSLTNEKQHTLIWRQNAYEHVVLNDITWIEANGSYCYIHTIKERKFIISYPLARIEECLPEGQFIRIQRSYIVNINHVKSLVGQSFIIGKHVFKIGKEYKEKVLNKFLFLGIRNKQPHKRKSNKES